MLKCLLGFTGRLFISLIFLASGLSKILNWQESEQLIETSLTNWMAMSQGSGWVLGIGEWILPYLPILLIVAVCFEILGGLCVLLGVQVRLGALLLALFLIPTTLVMHPFWMVQGPEYEVQAAHFLKNLSVLGGLLILLAYGKCGSYRGEHSEQ
ncbi:MAG: DoxX family protein [Rhabdochlamydiaceae bacterium]|nr:DoxX family protein [Rhabdochlamydiaceae bacterium]